MELRIAHIIQSVIPGRKGRAIGKMESEKTSDAALSPAADLDLGLALE
jgi:hypothetical protein